MHFFHTVIEAAALIIDATASAVMVWGFLAALVLIRTTVGFFLNREIQEVGAKIQR